MGQGAVTIDLRGDDTSLNHVLDGATRNCESFGTKIASVFTGVGAALTAAFAVGKIVGFAKDAFAEIIGGATEAEESEKRLAAVIKATGGAAGYTGEELVKYADHLESVTKFQSEATQGAMGVIATFKNIRGEQFLKATELAQDMATVLKTDVQGAAMQVAKALNDPLQGINALRRAGVSFTESQKKQIDTMLKAGDVISAQKVILNELAAEFGGAAKEVGGTFSGGMEILKNRIGAVTDQLGGVFMSVLSDLGTALEPVLVVVENLTPAFIKWTESIVMAGKTMIGSFVPYLQLLLDSAIFTFSAFEVAIENWRDIVYVTALKAGLGIISAWENVKYFFTTVLPTTLTWFADNWWNIFKDLYFATGAILYNMGKNIWDFVVAVKDMLQGKGFNFEFTALLEGFEATTKKFPEIAGRMKTQLEKSLESQINSIETDLGNKLLKKFQDNKKALTEAAKKEEKKAPELEDKSSKEFDSEGFKTIKDKKEKKEKGGGEFVGLEELHKSISSAAAGKTPEEKATDKVKDAVEKSGDEIVEAIEKDKKEEQKEEKPEKPHEDVHMSLRAQNKAAHEAALAANRQHAEELQEEMRAHKAEKARKTAPHAQLEEQNQYRELKRTFELMLNELEGVHEDTSKVAKSLPLAGTYK